MKKLNAIGMTCGVGSMLVGARRAGFKILGNVEWRPYYYTGTFEHNFPGAFLTKSLTSIPENLPAEIDLLMGHPECGNYSSLRTSPRKLEDPSDIPLFVDGILKLRPKFFVMDNLPKSLMGFTASQWNAALASDYYLFPEWVSNYHYGNVQLNRRRFFMIGARRDVGEKFVFVPGEFHHDRSLRDAIRDLPDRKDIFEMNHVHWKRSDVIPCGWSAHQFKIVREGNRITYGELMDHFKDHPVGRNFTYYNLKGQFMTRPGYSRVRLDHPAPVMSGGGSALDNHYREDTMLPLTVRERARIQGCPDDFIFLPLDNQRKRQMYNDVYKQVGKFMPIEFCTFVSRQVAAYLKGRKFEANEMRMVRPDPYVTEAKLLYCSEFGYAKANREAACIQCWATGCSLRKSGPADSPPVVEKRPSKKRAKVQKTGRERPVTAPRAWGEPSGETESNL